MTCSIGASVTSASWTFRRKPWRPLSNGWVSYWMVALGPTVIILFVRAAWSLLSNKSNREPPSPPRRIEPTVAKDRL